MPVRPRWWCASSRSSSACEASAVGPTPQPDGEQPVEAARGRGIERDAQPHAGLDRLIEVHHPLHLVGDDELALLPQRLVRRGGGSGPTARVGGIGLPTACITWRPR